MRLTVCICTFNRAQLLERALGCLSEARRPGVGTWELLLIDNNSSDRTPSVAQDFATDLPLRYIKEERQGLSWSRNRALRECRGELLLFMDDDVRVEQDWMLAYLEAADDSPQEEFFGGRLLPDWSLGRPRWLVDEDLAHLQGLIGKYDLGVGRRPLESEDPIPFGANFGLRRSLFERMEPFRTDLGVVGRIPGRGEEAEYLLRARESGAAGGYVANALSYHLVNPRNLELRYLYRFGIEKGVAAARMSDGTERTSGSLASASGFLLRGVLQLMKRRGDRFRQCVINAGIEVGLRRERRGGAA